jgi:hypothetical protein
VDVIYRLTVFGDGRMVRSGLTIDTVKKRLFFLKIAYVSALKNFKFGQFILFDIEISIFRSNSHKNVIKIILSTLK